MRKLLAYCLVTAILSGFVGFRLGRTAPPSREQVVSYLSELNVVDLADLTRGLQAKWGVQAAPAKLQELPSR